MGRRQAHRITTERERSVALERLIARCRVVALVFAAVQTTVMPGDSVALSWSLVVLLAATSVGAFLTLARPRSPRAISQLAVLSTLADAVVVGGVLCNNLTDPADPVYVVTLLPAVIAAMRWSLVGGVVGGVVSGAAAAVWTWGVSVSVGEPFVPAYASLRAGALIVLGCFIGSMARRLNAERRTLQQILEVSRDVIVTVDANGVLLSANDACRTVLRCEPEDLIGRCYRDFLQGQTTSGSALAEALTNGGPTPLIERQFRRPDGSTVWLELRVTPVPDAGIAYAVGRDITERRAAAEQLATSEQRFRSLFDHSVDAVFSFDLEGRFTSANPAAIELGGFELDELQQLGFQPLIVPEFRDVTQQRFARAATGRAQTYETAITTKAGERRDLHVTNLPIVVGGSVVGVFGVAKDVTERRLLERALDHQAHHDALTGLPNRALLESRLAEALADPPATGLALLFVDLDRFKLVNDSLGHSHGDDLLRDVVDRLRDAVRPADLLARFAGDEFCVVLYGAGHPETAVTVAERILASIDAPFLVDGREVFVSASIGVAVATADDTPDTLLHKADHAMYQAKSAGRARLAVYSPAAGSRTSRLDLETDLRRALERRELSLVYQPIVQTTTGEVASVEALVRWVGPDGRVRSPAEFIPVAEEANLMPQLRRFVLGEACGQLRSWDDEGIGRGTLAVAVNVSANDLTDHAFVGDVEAALAASGLPARRLVLEVTESALVADPGAVAPAVERLQVLGVRLAVDDFGTGYSSLAQLKRLPVAVLKIDRAFVATLEDGESDVAIVRSVIGLAEALEMRVVAEGVERIGQLKALVEVGCVYAQGYLLARPAPADAIAPVLAAGRVTLRRDDEPVAPLA